MQFTTTLLNKGSVHVRLYPDDVDLSTKPPYVTHTILEPQEDDPKACEVAGMTEGFSKELSEAIKDAARHAGFTYYYFKRYKEGRQWVVKRRL